VAAVALDQRAAQAVGVLLKLLEGRALRSDEPAAEDVVTVAPYPHDASGLMGDLETARGLAQRTRPIAGLRHAMSLAVV
jgi:hypothetical protein